MNNNDTPYPTRHSELSTNMLVAGLFFGGMFSGTLLATYLAPSSEVAIFIGFMVWPFSFGISMSMWYSLTSSDLLIRLIRGVLKSLKTMDLNGSLKNELAGADLKMITGTKVFVPTTVLVSFFAGLTIACGPTTQGFEIVVCTFTSFGLIYGMLVTWLARAGILPMPKAV